MHPYLPFAHSSRKLGLIALLVTFLVCLAMFLTAEYIYDSILEYRSTTLREQAKLLKSFLEAEPGSEHDEFVRHFFHDKQASLEGHSELLADFVVAGEKDGRIGLVMNTQGEAGNQRETGSFFLLDEKGKVWTVAPQHHDHKPLSEALAGREGIHEYTGPDGEKMMVVYLPVNLSGKAHGLLAKVSVHGLHEILMHKVTLIAVTAVILIGLGAWIFFRLNPILMELTKSQEDAIAMLGQASHYKDTDTGVHVERMAEYSVAIGKAMGMKPKELYMLGLAAKMHDLGKVGTPDAVLKKPAKLDPEEWKVMKQHSYMGSLIMGPGSAPLFKMAQQIALGHHEKYDGKGYPRGISKDEIPLTARITAVADVFDALTMKRPYKDEWPVEKALALIQEEAGSHFDEKVVKAFMGIQDEIMAIKAKWKEQELAELEELMKDSEATPRG